MPRAYDTHGRFIGALLGGGSVELINSFADNTAKPELKLPTAFS